jgi:hypothetical protein
VADIEVDGDFQFERQKVGTTPIDLRRLADWLVEHEVDEVVMESTAQYWRPVWEALEQHWRPSAAHAPARRRSRARSIWPKRNRIVDPADARGTFPMRSGW